MAKRPSKEQDDLADYFLPLSDKGKTKMISCRIDESLYNAFQNAADKSEALGLGRLSITHVVETAMRKLVNRVSGRAVQQNLPFDSVEDDEQQDDEQEQQPDEEQEKPKRTRKSRKSNESQTEQPDGE